MSQKHPHRFHGRCGSCGKRIYLSRKEARYVARRQFPADRMQAYQCPVSGDWWHIGHIAPEVVSGEVSKAVFYAPNGVGLVRFRQGTRAPIKRQHAA